VQDGKIDMTREGMGNFSYGATAAELGLPNYLSQSLAGTMQWGQNAKRWVKNKPLAPSQGVPFLVPPYGDDKRDANVTGPSHYYRPDASFYRR
jgi:hypothetical protein